MGFRGMRCVVQVRRFGRDENYGPILFEIVKAVCVCRLKELYWNLP